MNKFPTEQVAFFSASIICGLEALHDAKICFRDLKAANILLDFKSRAKLADFGLASDVSEKLATGSAGTNGFWAPEQLEKDNNGYDTSCDIWTLGVCIYHWSTGSKPFVGRDKEYTKELIREGEYDKTLLRSEKSLIEGLLVVNPRERLGVHGRLQSLKDHEYFSGINWLALKSGKLEGPLKIRKVKPIWYWLQVE